MDGREGLRRPGEPASALTNLGICIFHTDQKRLAADAQVSMLDFPDNLIYISINTTAHQEIAKISASDVTYHVRFGIQNNSILLTENESQRSRSY